MPSKHRSLKGQLILDGGSLKGSFFHRTVLLICQHDEQGAFGLVLNRSTDKPVSELILEDLPQNLKSQEVFLGGPVQPSALSYLHTDQILLAANVMKNVALGHSLEEMVELANNGSPNQRIKIFAGYAGWSPGQLDEEMKRNAWLTHPASIDLIFSTDTRELWRQILRSKGWKEGLLADEPEDLSAN